MGLKMQCTLCIISHVHNFNSRIETKWREVTWPEVTKWMTDVTERTKWVKGSVPRGGVCPSVCLSVRRNLRRSGSLDVDRSKKNNYMYQGVFWGALVHGLLNFENFWKNISKTFTPKVNRKKEAHFTLEKITGCGQKRPKTVRFWIFAVFRHSEMVLTEILNSHLISR